MADLGIIIGISTLGVAVVAIGGLALFTRKNRSRRSKSSRKSSSSSNKSNYDIGTEHFDKKTGEMYRIGPLLLPHEKDKKEDWADILNSPHINQETKDQILASLGRGKKSSNKKSRKSKKNKKK
jgi:hypothetical protein